MEEAGSVSCILCSANLPQRALALTLDPAPVLSFTKLLLGTETNPWQAPLFSHSPYLLFCFNCHVKIHEIHEIFNTLDNLREQLNVFRMEVEVELLRADGAGGNCARNKSAALRHTLIRELNLDSDNEQVDSLHDDESNQLEVKDEANELHEDIYFDDGMDDLEDVPDPCDSDKDGDYVPDPDTELVPIVPDSESQKTKPELSRIIKTVTSTGQTVVLKPCQVELGNRIDHSSGQGDPCMLLPKKCPVPECPSKLEFSYWAQFARHMKAHRTKWRKIRPSGFSIDPSPMHSTSFELAKQKLRSIKYPAKCPKLGCISTKVFVDKNQFHRHLRSVHFKEMKPLTVDPDLSERLNSAKYPAHCFQPNCFRDIPFDTKDELQRHLRLVHFIRCKIPCHIDPILNETKRSTFPTPCPREGCNRSKKIYQDRGQLRRHLRHVHGSHDGLLLNDGRSSPDIEISITDASNSFTNKRKKSKRSKKRTLSKSKETRRTKRKDNQHGNEDNIIDIPSVPHTSTRLRHKKPINTYAESDDDDQERNSKKISTEDDSTGFRCSKPNCRSRHRVFKSEFRYKSHLRYAHGELKRTEPWKDFNRQCQRPDCKSTVVFKYAYLYRNHMRGHARAEADPRKTELKIEYPAKCPRENCESKVLYKDRNTLRHHIHYVHEKKLQPHVIQESLSQELSAVTFPTNCFIPNCPSKLVFAFRAQLQRHIKASHRIRAKPSPSLDALTIELKATEFPTRCIRKDCPKDKIYYELDILRRHIKCFHNKARKEPEPIIDNGYVCSICAESFNSLLSLLHHERQHDKTVNMSCEHCGAGFKLKSSLKVHMDAHHSSVAPVFLCTQCPKTFKVKRLLDVHILRHAGVKKYFCRVCTKGYMYRQEVCEHERFVHWEQLGLEPIKCTICQKTYSKMGALRQHMRSHTGNQRHACTQCAYKTEHKNDLSEHMATVHCSDFPFECSMCDKKFKLERRLRQHELEHKDDYTNMCELCDKRFSTARTLRIHNEKKHGVLPASRDDSRHGTLAEFVV